MFVPYRFCFLLCWLHLSPLYAASKQDDRVTYQTIDGFGVSQAFQRSAQMHGKFGLSPENQKKVLDLLFSNTGSEGAGLTILRNGIGSSTSSEKDFMKSIAPTSPGSPNATLKYEWDGKDESQVWLTQEAIAYGRLKTIYADAWSAPAYMKTNNNDSNGGSICGVSNAPCTTGDWRQAYANYLIQYLRFYQETGINITHLGFLNEPDLNQTYASMLSSGFQAADFLQILRPTLDASGFANVKIVCCEATGWDQQAAMLSELQSIPGASDTLSVIAAHGYASDPKLPYRAPQRVWQTEWADLNGRWNPSWDDLGKFGEGIGWANKIQQALTVSNCSAFLYWIGAETTSTNSALIKLDKDTVTVSARLWAFAHFSRFVEPGAKRVRAESDKGFVGVSAFVNGDGGVVVQVLNLGHVGLGVRIEILGIGRIILRWFLHTTQTLNASKPPLQSVDSPKNTASPPAPPSSSPTPSATFQSHDPATQARPLTGSSTNAAPPSSLSPSLCRTGRTSCPTQ
ncbi:glycoside hydrolase [Delitschia confertaspora ATCC 74209]|uniref:Glycoside hydrolase n=1 Tax=Delitschia confertaspora ATCC 74209 TaxID=1513339 RepID=A0A9P4MQU2_9PLEO|nr:glycoside hydrolase [Delitschia confertaspora ATCC 74209]